MKVEIINRSCVTGKQQGFFSYSGWPTVCIDENGVIYAVCSGMRMGHVCPFGKTLMYKSRDGGKTWSVPSVINDHFLDDRDAGILYLGGGRMLVTRFSHPADVYEKDYAGWMSRDIGKPAEGLLSVYPEIRGEDRKGGSFVRLSGDYGETWDDEIRVPVSGPHGPSLLDDGSILYLGKEMYSYGAEKPDIIAAYTSKDGGRSFEKTGECIKPDEYGWNQFHEPHCIQLDDGRILGVIRSHIDKNGENFTIYKTFSEDRGKTWSSWEPTGICGSPPFLLKLKDGRVILTYGRRMEPFGIYAKVISPDGTFGDGEYLVDSANDSDIGYPASVEKEDGSILTVYYKRRDGENYCSIMSTNWKL